MKEAVLTMLKRYTISEGETHVGLLEFSSSVKVVSPLNKHNTLSRIEDIVTQLQPSRGSGRVSDEALRVASDQVFDVSKGGRSGASKVLVILTHGKSTGDVPPTEAVKPLKNRGVNIFVVAIGPGVDPEETKEIATSGKHVFPVDDPEKTPNAIGNVVDKLKNDLDKGND